MVRAAKFVSFGLAVRLAFVWLDNLPPVLHLFHLSNCADTCAHCRVNLLSKGLLYARRDFNNTQIHVDIDPHHPLRICYGNFLVLVLCENH